MLWKNKHFIQEMQHKLTSPCTVYQLRCAIMGMAWFLGQLAQIPQAMGHFWCKPTYDWRAFAHTRCLNYTKIIHRQI